MGPSRAKGRGGPTRGPSRGGATKLGKKARTNVAKGGKGGAGATQETPEEQANKQWMTAIGAIGLLAVGIAVFAVVTDDDEQSSQRSLSRHDSFQNVSNEVARGGGGFHDKGRMRSLFKKRVNMGGGQQRSIAEPSDYIWDDGCGTTQGQSVPFLTCIDQRIRPEQWRGNGFNEPTVRDTLIQCYDSGFDAEVSCKQEFRETITAMQANQNLTLTRSFFSLLLCAHKIYPELYDNMGYSNAMIFGRENKDTHDKLCVKSEQYSECLFQMDPDDVKDLEKQKKYNKEYFRCSPGPAPVPAPANPGAAPAPEVPRPAAPEGPLLPFHDEATFRPPPPPPAQPIGSWDYTQHGKDWPQKFPQQCGGTSQSPVDIDIKTIRQDQSLSFELTYYEAIMMRSRLKNEGFTLALWFAEGWKPPTILGSATNGGTYEFSGLHFHWGERDEVGSEHSINGIHYPLEMHIVHINSKYNGSFEIAKKQPDGIVMLAVLFQVIQGDNPNLESLVDLVHRGQEPNAQATPTHALNLRMLLPDNIHDFYRYKGSLTTPNCDESVTWIILAQAKPIGAKQLMAFRQAQYPDKSPMINNYRDVQPLNNRIIDYSKH